MKSRAKVLFLFLNDGIVNLHNRHICFSSLFVNSKLIFSFEFFVLGDFFLLCKQSIVIVVNCSVAILLKLLPGYFWERNWWSLVTHFSYFDINKCKDWRKRKIVRVWCFPCKLLLNLILNLGIIPDFILLRT